MNDIDITTEKQSSKAKELQIAQIRECFARVVNTHKTHEKQADILVQKEKFWKCIQTILSVIVPGTFLATLGLLFGHEKICTLIGLLLSAVLAVINLYLNNSNYGVELLRHEKIAVQLWDIRERYLSLITDLMINSIDIDSARKIRDDLMIRLENIYMIASRTSQTSYKKAQKGLKFNEELTFSSNEIDMLLPEKLRLNVNKEEQ